ncbi:DNA-binding protein [Streptomyces bingchenggensis BCW-1]|uniref:DNA-binding protein n=1 Tax=Streptomyces bingchenggensis (strain BCW-1) TaxID=749414 RepID=D7CG82_STRBB|nr:DNA-binding protein [Streptomyces bingchenggensis BCW-1]
MIDEFALSYVPGILQTERYARAVLRSGFPPRSDEECDRLVVTRLERAKILDAPITPVVWALLDEAVLLSSMLTLMWFEDQPPAAYSEGVSIGKLHDSPALVEQLRGAYVLALSDALPLKESLALMRATSKEYGRHA